MKHYKDKGLLKNFLAYLKFLGNYKWVSFQALIFALVRFFPNYSFPVFIKIVVDSYIPTHNINGIYMIVGIVSGLGVIVVLYQTGFAIFRTDVTQNICKDLRNVIIDKLQILSLSFHDRSETGRYYSKIMVDVERVRRFSLILFNVGINLFFGILYSFLILYFVNAKILGYSITLILFYVILYNLFKKRLAGLQHQGRMATEDLSQEVNIFIQTNILARVHGEEEFQREQINDTSEKIVSKYKHLISNIALFNSTNWVSSRIFQISIIAVAAIGVIKKELLIGEMFLFIQYFNMIMHVLTNLVNQFPMILEFSEGMNSINEILNDPDIEFNEGKKKVKKINGDIKFNNVSFAYSTSKRKVLKQISIEIKKGETVALVGPSGAGKTTFINLVLGLYRKFSGDITIDNHSINEIDMRIIRKQIGVVTQDPIIFSGTIAENIGHARDRSIRDLEDATKKACAYEFIKKLPKKFDALIGERGVTLSGGERQRVAIARAIMRKPSILIFDEATSALDSNSEKKVQQAIENMFGNQTTIVIAHRLSTIFHANNILVFKNGRIIETGSHKELVKKDGEYTKLLSLQFNLNAKKLKKIIK